MSRRGGSGGRRHESRLAFGAEAQLLTDVRSAHRAETSLAKRPPCRLAFTKKSAKVGRGGLMQAF